MKDISPTFPFETLVFRTPLFPYDAKHQQPELIHIPVFEEALFLGSPELHQEIKANSNSKGKDPKLAESLCKYFNRSYIRCTPFGLFAGCSTGKLTDNTGIELVDESESKID